MEKRGFLKTILGLTGLTTIAGCMSRIGKNVDDQQAGDPYQCERCGYLTRSTADISGDRCPRCGARKLVKITENEMAEALKKQI